MSLLLVLCLLAALSTPAFAEAKKLDSYLMIGDSNFVADAVPATKTTSILSRLFGALIRR